MSRVIRRILRTILALMLLPLISLPVLAEDYSARLDSLHFDITLQEDGSAWITETREVSFTGDHEFTRYGVSNAFTGPRVFTDWEVILDGEPLSMLEAPDNENRPEGTFAVEEGDGENTLYIYHRSESTTRTFQITYRVENAVKLYSDVGEFHWNLTGESGISSIDLVTANLMVPEGIPEEDFRIWAHGPLNGTFEKQDGAYAYLQVEYVPYGTIVDLRTTIPAEFFTGGWAQEGEALPEILAEEQALADSANAKREEEAQKEAQWQAEQEAYWAARYAWEAEHPLLAGIENFCLNTTWFFEDMYMYYIEELWPVWLGVMVIAAYVITRFVYQNLPSCKKRRYKPQQSPQYYRQLPDRRPAPCADLLLKMYKKSGNDVSRHISAALLELNLQNKLQFRTGSRDTEIILNQEYRSWPAENQIHRQSQPRTVRMIRNADGSTQVYDSRPETAQERGYLDILWSFLQEAVGEKGRITVGGLKSYVKGNMETACNFRNDFEAAERKAFRKQVHVEQPVKTRLLANKPLLIIPVVVGVLTLLLCAGSSLYDGPYWFGCILVSAVVGGLVLLVGLAMHFAKNSVLGSISFLDQKSENDLALWEAFGRFLDDFTTFDRKELPEFPVWREYMVYAVAMGKGQKVAKALAVKYPEIVASQDDLYDDAYYRMLQDMALYEALDSIGQEVAVARPPRAASSSGSDSWDDNWSDSDGGGGGFSDSGGGSDSGSRGDFAD